MEDSHLRAQPMRLDLRFPSKLSGEDPKYFR